MSNCFPQNEAQNFQQEILASFLILSSIAPYIYTISAFSFKIKSLLLILKRRDFSDELTLKFLFSVMLVAQSCSTFCDPTSYSPTSLLCPCDSPGKNTGVDCHSLLQRIFLTQGLNPGLFHCRQILYHLSYREDPKRGEMQIYFGRSFKPSN